MRSESQSLLIIDGSHGEGGGALFRTALAMSALTQQPVRIQNVRAGSRYSGLDVEDLTLMNALSRISKAEVIGGRLGSESVSFLPTIRPTGYKGEIEALQNEAKRGANALVVLGSLVPILARSGVYSSVIAHGETFGTHAVTYDYFANVALPVLQKAGLYAFPDLVRAGYGRESHGTVALDIEPSVIRGLEWADRGGLRAVHAVVTTSQIPSSVGERIVAHLKTLSQNSGLKLHALHRDVDSKTAGAFVTTWAEYDRGMGGGAAMGAKGLRGETLAQMAFEEMFDWMSGSATVDPFLADQILLPLVLAEEPSTFSVSRLTQRFLTMVWVIKQFTPIHITVRGLENGPGVIRIERR